MSKFLQLGRFYNKFYSLCSSTVVRGWQDKEEQNWQTRLGFDHWEELSKEQAGAELCQAKHSLS